MKNKIRNYLMRVRCSYHLARAKRLNKKGKDITVHTLKSLKYAAEILNYSVASAAKNIGIN